MTDPVSVTSALDVVEGVDLTGETCVITGASSGPGRESARALASTGVRLVLAARNRPGWSTSPPTATTPDLAGRSGLYLADCAVRSDAGHYALDLQRAADLWALSERPCAD